MKIRNLLIATGISLLAVMSSCKPTEAGYKAAYDAAQAKRTAEQNDAAMYGGMIREGAPQWRRVGSDSVLYIQQPLAPLEGDTLPMRNVNVAIAAYKMTTNARAHAERLVANGMDARVLRNRTDNYYVIAAQLDSLSQAVGFINLYVKQHPSDLYSGLPGQPVVTVPSGRRVK